MHLYLDFGTFSVFKLSSQFNRKWMLRHTAANRLYRILLSTNEKSNKKKTKCYGLHRWKSCHKQMERSIARPLWTLSVIYFLVGFFNQCWFFVRLKCVIRIIRWDEFANRSVALATFKLAGVQIFILVVSLPPHRLSTRSSLSYETKCVHTDLFCTTAHINPCISKALKFIVH